MTMTNLQDTSSAWRLARLLLVVLLLAAASLTGVLRQSTTQAAASLVAQSSDSLPPATLDALDGNRWSLTSIDLAPGQTVQITNRGALMHTFLVDEWEIDVEIPSLETVEITVPSDLKPGQQFIFYCDEPGHRALGQWGTITIVTPDQIRSAQDPGGEGDSSERLVIQTGDDYTYTPSDIEVSPGEVIEVQNNGVIQHQFAVDEWQLNETITAGESVLIQIPDSVQPGQTFVFYCTVPGHRAGGMEGNITIVAAEGQEDTPPPRRDESDLSRFLPPADMLGTGWTQVRTGNARSVLPDYEDVGSRIFPGEGRGAAYVGPNGSRATILVLSFTPEGTPTNQIEDAVLAVQLMMMSEWETDLRVGRAFDSIAPPPGCDVANRASGVTRMYTLPAGSTVCQLRNVGIAIFVSVEGQYADATGVEAADEVLIRLLQRASFRPYYA